LFIALVGSLEGSDRGLVKVDPLARVGLLVFFFDLRPDCGASEEVGSKANEGDCGYGDGVFHVVIWCCCFGYSPSQDEGKWVVMSYGK